MYSSIIYEYYRINLVLNILETRYSFYKELEY